MSYTVKVLPLLPPIWQVVLVGAILQITLSFLLYLHMMITSGLTQWIRDMNHMDRDSQTKEEKITSQGKMQNPIE